ncbi:Glutathione synthase/RimK-type ligase, ATP-grasp superfamily [Luteibacter sp. UNCMF366Tsu5.1]|nr:Glutathione synthase/RimK-type ligase, ATP-grasp superfamily [Luteibacter sp. UNCMF366Tsu5.1]
MAAISDDMDVLIVSTAVDAATDEVVRILSERGAQVARLNTEELPFDASLSVDFHGEWATTLQYQGKCIAASTIWYRRIRAPQKPEAMDPGIYDFCLRENRAALLGGLMAQSARWLNHPAAVWEAEFKPFQLRIAKEVGLPIPRTLISNDPDAIARAHAHFGRTIVKPARSGHFWREGEEYAIFTSLLTDEHLDALSDAKWTPSIYQELIPKDVDVRVTWVGGRIFAAAIHSQTDPLAVVDWRKTGNAALPHSRLELPQPLLDKLHQLMIRLGLAFGCIDLVRTPSGEYVFLEVNPSGQWLWLDDQLGLGISSAVADWLIGP